MSELTDRLRKEAAERAKEPDWFDEQLFQDIAEAAKILEAQEARIKALEQALRDIKAKGINTDE